MLDVAEVIMRYVQQNGKVTSKQIIEHTGLPRSTVLKEISKLTNAGKLDAIGKPPGQVFYQLAQIQIQGVPTQSKPTPADNKPLDPSPESPPPGQPQTPPSQPSREDLARRADDLAYRTLGWDLYARGKTLIQGVLSRRFQVGIPTESSGLGRDVFKGKPIPKPWIIGGLIVLAGWLVIQYIWLPLRQGELARTKEELAQAQQQLAQNQDIFKAQLASVQSELTTTKAQLAQVQRVGDHLTMDQIVALTQQGIPGDEIIDRIKASHYVYGLTASDLSWLRQHGVVEAVIQAMQETNPASASHSNSNGQTQSQVVDKVWGWVQNKINGL